MEKICKVDGCERKVEAKGYCERHYCQIRRCGHIYETHFDRPAKTCMAKGCEVIAKTMGYCKRHYGQILRLGKIIETSFDRSDICSIKNCNKKVKAKGFCSKHYTQSKRYGKILERTRCDPNKIIIEKDIAYIQLYDKNSNVAGHAIIDKQNVDKCKKHKWHLDNYGYVSTKSGGKKISLHNFILDRKSTNKIQTDHRNQIKHDCRKSNLRLCTPNENKYNVNLICTNTSGFKGVHFCKQTKKWVASIRANNQFYSLGYFAEKIEAVRAWNEAAKKLHGEFAVLSPLGEVR